MDPKDCLSERNRLTEELYDNRYDINLYLARAIAYENLGFPDLAAGDAYRALRLTDEVQDESGDYHEHALDALKQHRRRREPKGLPNGANAVGEDAEQSAENTHLDTKWDGVDVAEGSDADELIKEVHQFCLECYHLLSRCLVKCGCLRSAYDFCLRGLSASHDSTFAQRKDAILSQHRRRKRDEDSTWDESSFNPKLDLPDLGSVRKELYPWNTHEPDRFSDATLQFLNNEVSKVAPSCEVHAVSLPLLTEDGLHQTTNDHEQPTIKQLGLFAKEDITPGAKVLNESSILTANNRLHYPLCDACSSELPQLDATDPLLACDECDDIVFCSQVCFDLAMQTYHPAVCGRDVEAIGKDTDLLEATNALYLLLLGRVIALAETQEIHPLELKEVRYIWGDFMTPEVTYLHSDSSSTFSTARHLPFSFTYNIVLPLHVLEKMDIDIYASLPKYDTWILNTLYAKFRGTASARLSKQDGRPEVCAVHPIWCLANHSCDPNVTWEWGGNITFTAREERAEWNAKDKRKGGIRTGEEILSHYCDIEMGVRDRRQWAVGALGGMCVCERCVWEETHLEMASSIGTE